MGFLPFAGNGLIGFAWWLTLAMLENIRNADTYLQFDVVANGGSAGLGLWPNGLQSFLVTIPSIAALSPNNDARVYLSAGDALPGDQFHSALATIGAHSEAAKCRFLDRIKVMS